jgi:putative oxidoreductase
MIAIERLRLAAATLALLGLRLALGLPFLRSGLTKWDGFGHLSDSAVYLFTGEFRLHVFGRELPYPFPATMALLSGCAEVGLSVLLLAGLATRLSAAGLLGMTVIIQLTVPDGWLTYHLPWAAMALTLLTGGGGALSGDRLLEPLWRPLRQSLLPTR